MNLFNKQYVTTFLVQEGVKDIHKKDFMNINYIQYLHIPESVQTIESGTFFHLKKIILLKCEIKWKDDKYFPFTYYIKEGTKIIDRDIFREWYNLKKLSIPNSVTTILPFTFVDCQEIEYLKCSPEFFKFLNVSREKNLILPEGIENLNKGDLKGCVNLVYLKLEEKDSFEENIKTFFKFIRDKPSIDKPDYNFECNNDIANEYKEEADNNENEIQKEQNKEENENENKTMLKNNLK